MSLGFGRKRESKSYSNVKFMAWIFSETFSNQISSWEQIIYIWKAQAYYVNGSPSQVCLEGPELSPGGEVYILLSPGCSNHVSSVTLWNELPFWDDHLKGLPQKGLQCLWWGFFVFSFSRIPESTRTLGCFKKCFGRHHAVI